MAGTTIGIRTLRWKYVRYVTGDGELYDLVHDPNELHNHVADPAYAGVRAWLQRVWRNRSDCADARYGYRR